MKVGIGPMLDEVKIGVKIHDEQSFLSTEKRIWTSPRKYLSYSVTPKH